MGEVPEMWRIELLHPAVVHFPIALLIVGALAWLAGRWVGRSGRWAFLTPAGRLLLAIGAAFAWAAVYTGDLANAEVARTLCDPTVKQDHEQFAYTAAILFTAVVAADFALLYFKPSRRVRTVSTALLGAALVVGIALIGYVGHLGSTLVYQQGAAVYHPSEDCSEFE